MSEPQELKLFFPLCFGGKNKPKKKNNNNKKQPMKVDHYTLLMCIRLWVILMLCFGKRQEQKLHKKLIVTLNAELPLFSLVWDKPTPGECPTRGKLVCNSSLATMNQVGNLMIPSCGLCGLRIILSPA